MSFANNCIWNATTTSNSAFVVASAFVSGLTHGYTPAQCLDPLIIDGAPYHYSAIDSAGNKQEGDGTWSAATSTLTSTNIRNSTNGGSAVTFISPPVVIMGDVIGSDLLAIATASFTLYVDGTNGSDTANTGFQKASGATNAATTTSSNVLNFASVPVGAAAGQSAYDSTTGRYVGCVAPGGIGVGTVTLTANAATAVGNGDTIVFASAFASLAKAISTASGYNYVNLYFPTIWLSNGSYAGIQQPLPLLVGLPPQQPAVIHGDSVSNTLVHLADSGTGYTLQVVGSWEIYGLDLNGTFGGIATEPGALLTLPQTASINLSGSFSQWGMLLASLGACNFFKGSITVSAATMANLIFNGGIINLDQGSITFSNAITISGSVYSGDSAYSFIGFNGGAAFVNPTNVTCSGVGGATALALTNGAKFETDGNATSGGAALTRANFPGASSGGVGVDGWSMFGPDNAIVLTSGMSVSWNSNPSGTGATQDLNLWRGTANTLLQHNGTNAQGYDIANTYSGAGANYEIGVMSWLVSTNVLAIGTFNAGTGVARPIQFYCGNTAIADFGETTPSIWTFDFSMKLAAGTTSAPSMTIPSGSLLTTAAAGAWEYDGTCAYFTSVASSRQVVATEQFQVLSSNRTFASNTSAQAIFNATTNGAITLQGNTTYEFEMILNITGLSSSSKSLSLGFGGTATVTSIQYIIDLYNSAGAIVGGFETTASATLILSGSTSTLAAIKLKGIVRINAGGTFIPQLTQTATTAAYVANANSYIKFKPMGSGSVTNIGDWS